MYNYGAYDEIERKPGVGHDTTRKVATCAFEWAGCEDTRMCGGFG